MTAISSSGVPAPITVKTKKEFEEQSTGLFKDPTLAVAARISGSTVDIALANDKVLAHYDIDIKKVGSQDGAVKVLFEIFDFIAEKAYEIGQNVLPIDLGIAGGETSIHGENFRGNDKQNLPMAKGLNYLANVEFAERPAGTQDYDSPKAIHLVNFIDRINTSFNSTEFNLKYSDEANSITKTGFNSSPWDFAVDFKVANDTVQITNQVIKNLQENENVISMVLGSGFNIGIAEGFNKVSQSFKSQSNTELGQFDLSGSSYITELDNELLEKGLLESFSSEKLFSAGSTERSINNGAQARLDYLRNIGDEERKTALKEFLAEAKLDGKYNLEEALESKLLEQDSLDYSDITAAAKKNDVLAMLLLEDQVTKLSQFIKDKVNSKYQSIIDSPDTKNFVITGSFFKALYDIPNLKEIFDANLNKDRRSNNLQDLELSFIEKHDMDGMKELIRAKAALLKASN